MLEFRVRWSETDVRLTGEPDDIERVTSGSEGGGWKSARKGSLAGRLPYGGVPRPSLTVRP